MYGSDSRLRVLFLTLYPEIVPSSRLRVYQYLPLLAESNIEATVIPAVEKIRFSAVGTSHSRWRYFLQYSSEFFGTFQRALKSGRYDVVFIQKGVLLTNFHGLERLFICANKHLVFDLDDAVYGTNIMEFSSPWLRWLQDCHQTEKLSRHCRAVVTGNRYLKDIALRFNENVSVIPTPVDTERIVPRSNGVSSLCSEFVIGWMGMPSGLMYLDQIKEALKILSGRFPIRLCLVTRLSGKSFDMPGVKTEIIDWTYESETLHMQRFDVAISPQPDNEWTRGKCSLKLLQYMAAGLPTVASRAGMNCEVINDGVDGYLANETDEWVDKLSALIREKDLRQKMGRSARRKVVEEYELKKMAPKLVAVIRKAASS